MSAVQAPRVRARMSLFLPALLLFALIGAALLTYATTPGVGLVNDSAAYLSGARSLLAGQGYARLGGNGQFRPLTHFPPLFSLLLAGIGLFGMNAIDAARLAALALFPLNILLVGLLARQVSGVGWVGLLAAALFLCSEALLRVHTFALSEPLFLALTLAALLCLARVVKTPAPHWGWLLTAGLLSSLSYLTRYVGAALFAAAVFALLFLLGVGWKACLRASAVFLAGALPPVAAWSIRNTLLTGSATNRGLAWHPIAASELAEGLRNAWAFLLPSRLDLYDRLPVWAWALLLILGLVLLAGWMIRLVLRTLRRGPPFHLAGLVGLHALAYLALIFASMTVADASTIFEDRILAPLYVDGLLLFAALLAWLRARFHGSRLAAPALGLLLLLSFADDARKAAIDLHRVGQGFAGPAWTNSLTVIAVKKLPPVTIYTNRLSALMILTDRPAYALLSPTDPVTELERPDIQRTYAEIHRAVLEGRAVLVVFRARQLLEQPDADWFRGLSADLPVWQENDDGIIYGFPPTD